MFKSRKSKYIFVVVMALCFVMAFSVSSFAAATPFYMVGTHFVDNGKFDILDGFTVITDATLWDDLKVVAQEQLNVNYLLSIQTGVESFYNTHYLVSDGSSGFGRLSASERLAIDNNINVFAGKQIQYITTNERDKVFCDYLGNAFLYISDGSVSPTYNINLNLQQSITSIAQNYFVSVTEQITETTVNNFYNEIQNIIKEEVNQYITEVYNNTDNSTTIEKQIINPTTNQFYDFSNDTTYDIEGITFDNDNRSYTLSVSADDNYYDYSVTYYNEYTYIMYLGSSEDYAPKAYKLYYELPDGRSSADLTADELAGMSVQFNDLVTYDRVPSDEVVKGLFHLDGDLDNSTVYDGVEMFFTSGASITYQEAANFDGSLYLPALSGARQIIIPLHDTSKSDLTYYSNAVTQYMYTSDGNTNFAGMPYNSPYSIDFRFYSYAAAGDTSKYLEVYGYDAYKAGGTYRADRSSNPILTLNGNSVIFNGRTFDGNQINNITASVSVGTWNHILINFEPYLDYDGYRYRQTCYLNGVLIGTVSSTIPTVQSSYIKDSMLLGFNMRSSSNTVPFMLDEIRITSANVPNLVSPVPYEDNLVWVLPDSANLQPNTLAIQSDYLSGKYRVGGIRPSMVEKGHVWFQISMNRIVSCQVYNGIMWEEVNCYVWTGSRWIPANYFDVVTLTDYYDIVDNTGLPTITTSEGFFSWFQREFKEFKDKAIAFFDAWEGGGGSAGGNVNAGAVVIAPSLTVDGLLDANISIDNEYQFDLGTNAGNILKDGFDGVSGIFRGFGQLTQGSNYGLITNFGNAVTTFFNSFLTPDGLFGYLFLNPFE